MIKYKEIYSFEVEQAIANYKSVNCIDRLMKIVQLVNEMTVQQYLSIVNHDNSDNRYEFYVTEKTEETEEKEQA